MPNLKEIRTRISSITTTLQVTSAMKMVSSAKLKKAQRSIMQMRPYAAKLEEIVSLISSDCDTKEDFSFTKERDLDNILIVIISSDSGLCGAFNSSIIKTALTLADKKYHKQYSSGNVDFFSIGKQGKKILKAKKIPVIEQIDNFFDTLDFEHSQELSEKIVSFFSDKKYDHIELVYNAFKNAGSQICTSEQFLPILPPKQDEKEKNNNLDFIFEPSQQEILEDILPRSLKVQFYSVLLDSYAAEQGARMTAMSQATDNATDLLKKLNLQFNKARQTAITNEIIEVTSGSMA